MSERALSPVLGFVLVFAIIVAGIGIIQTMFVPAWIKSVEAKHYFSIKSEFEELVEKAVDASNSGTSVVTFDLTLKYPKYPFLLTPNVASSTITVKKIGTVTINSTMLSQPILLDLLVVEFEPNYYYLTANKEVMILGDYFTSNGAILGESVLYGGGEINLIVINMPEGTYSGKKRLILYGNPPFKLNSAEVTIQLDDATCSEYDWYLNFMEKLFNVSPSSCKATISGKLNLIVVSTDENWSLRLTEKLVNSSFTISNENFVSVLSTDPSNRTNIEVPSLTTFSLNFGNALIQGDISLFLGPTYYLTGYTGYSNQPVNVTLEWTWGTESGINSGQVGSFKQSFVWYTLSNGYFQLPISLPADIVGFGVNISIFPFRPLQYQYGLVVDLNVTLQFPDGSVKTFYVRFT